MKGSKLLNFYQGVSVKKVFIASLIILSFLAVSCGSKSTAAASGANAVAIPAPTIK
jgi:hypothetical protein